MNVSAPTVSQRAAVAALGPEARLELQARALGRTAPTPYQAVLILPLTL